MKKRLIYTIVILLCVILLFFATYKLSKSTTYQVMGELTSEVNTDQKVIALTFDDGPTPNVDKILPLLEKYNAKATFFLIGNDMEKYPEETKKIVEAGHQVGNHTYSHKRMVFKTPSYIKEEIERTDQYIREAGFEGEIDFRPPYGKKLIILPYYLAKSNKETIMWNLEPDTYFTNPDEKVECIIKNSHPGSIILIHPMYDQTGSQLQVIEEVLETLTSEGYTFVTINELQAM